MHAFVENLFADESIAAFAASGWTAERQHSHTLVDTEIAALEVKLSITDEAPSKAVVEGQLHEEGPALIECVVVHHSQGIHIT